MSTKNAFDGYAGRRKLQVFNTLLSSPCTAGQIEVALSDAGLSSIYAALRALERDGYVGSRYTGTGRTRSRVFFLTERGATAVPGPTVAVPDDRSRDRTLF